MKVIIIYLSKRNDLNNLRKSLMLLYKNFNNKFNYPVIFFNDDFTNEDERKLFDINPNIKFERLKFEIPSWINENVPFQTEWSVGYRHIYRFFSGELYKQEVKKNFDWYLLLDKVNKYINYSLIKKDVYCANYG